MRCLEEKGALEKGGKMKNSRGGEKKNGVMSFKKRRAERLIEDGNLFAMQGKIEDAMTCYSESIKHYPTAEAYTYLGWMFSFLGQVDDAIDLCKQAILIDSDYGNPYNDIGSYLMIKGKSEEAIDWLERAKAARRYEPRHFPFINLGRIYMEKGEYKKAVTEFQEALRLDPGNEEVEEILHELNKKAA